MGCVGMLWYLGTYGRQGAYLQCRYGQMYGWVSWGMAVVVGGFYYAQGPVARVCDVVGAGRD